MPDSAATEEGGVADRRGGADDELLRALGGEMVRIGRHRAAAYPGALLDASAFRLLWLLSEGGPRTLRQLAADLQLEQSTVNRQVNAALRRRLVERYAEDGRAGRLLRPTEEGQAAYEHDGRLRARVYGEVLAELGPERAPRLIEDLRAFNDALDRAHQRLG